MVAYGIDKVYVQTGDFVMRAGKMIDPEKDNQIVISASIIEAVGIANAKDVIGTELALKVKLGDDNSIDRKFTIAGVLASGGGSEAFVSAKLFAEKDSFDFAGIKALANDRQAVPEIRRSIESLGYATTSPVDTLEQVDQFFRVLRVVLVSFGAIGMVIAILGMINTLTVSLLERTKEVALMLALGARPRDVNLLFVIEAVILSLVGGVIGIVSALVISGVTDIILNQVARSRGATAGFTVFSAPLWLVLSTLTMMACIGYLVAFLLARRAARINSIEVLRND